MLRQDEEMLKNSRNRVRISGKFTEEFKYAYTTDAGEYFFENKLEVRGKDGKIEYITIIASEYLLYDIEPVTRKYGVITGSIKTTKIKVEKSKFNSDVIVFAKRIDICEEKIKDENVTYFEGVIKRKITMRKGNNYVQVIFIAEQVDNKIINSIPYKFFGKDSKRIKRLPIGTKLQLEGQIDGKNKLRLFKDGSVQIIQVHSIRGLRFNVVK